MTISELVSYLERRRIQYGDCKVQVTWEGIFREITPAHIYLSKDGILYIDADDNRYKRDFAVDPNEGESLSAK